MHLWRQIKVRLWAFRFSGKKRMLARPLPVRLPRALWTIFARLKPESSKIQVSPEWSKKGRAAANTISSFVGKELQRFRPNVACDSSLGATLHRRILNQDEPQNSQRLPVGLYRRFSTCPSRKIRSGQWIWGSWRRDPLTPD